MQHADEIGTDPKPQTDDHPRTAIVLLGEVALLLGGLSAYLLLTDWGTGGAEGYALVVGIHLALLAVCCLVLATRLLTRRRKRSR